MDNQIITANESTERNNIISTLDESTNCNSVQSITLSESDIIPLASENQILELKCMLQVQDKKINTLTTLVKKILKNGGNSNNDPIEEAFNEEKNSFPLNTIVDIQLLEEKLKEDHFAKQFVRFLSRIIKTIF